MRKLCSFLAVLATVSAVHAENFFDEINFAVTPGAGTTKIVDVTINGIRATGTWDDVNLDNEFDDTEVLVGSITLHDRDGNVVLVSPAGIDGDATEVWATDNAEEILSLLAPGGVSQSSGQTEEALFGTRSFRDRVIKKVRPDEVQAAIDAAQRDVTADIEFVDLEIFGEDGHAVAANFSWMRTNDSGTEWGFNLPYRFTDLDDEADTQMHHVGIDLFIKKPIKESDDLTVNVGADIFGSVFASTSDAFEVSGQLKYGAGLFVGAEMPLGPGLLSFGTDVKVSQAYLPNSAIDEDDGTFLGEYIDYINDLDPVVTWTYGLNYGLQTSESSAVNLELMRSSFISSDIDSDFENQTSVGFDFTYYPSDVWELNIGVMHTFELEDIDLTTIRIGAIRRF